VAVTVTYTFLAHTGQASKWANGKKGERGVEDNTRQRWLNLSVSLVLSPVTQAGSPLLRPLQKPPMSYSRPLEVTYPSSSISIFPLTVNAYAFAQTNQLSCGNSLVTRILMATPNVSFVVIIILSQTSSSPLTASSLSLLPGTIHSAFGTSTLA
jgi:hypothetical protein